MLAVVAAGLLVWALTIQSDLDSTQQELDSAQQDLAGTQQKLDNTSKELDSAKQDAEELGSQLAEDDSHPGVALAAGKVLYDEFSAKLDAAREDLAANEQALAEAEKAMAQAEKDAAAAKEDAAAATDEAAKANAQAEQAKAEAEATESRAAAAAACAKSYISAFGGLFEGENPQDQADDVREELSRASPPTARTTSAQTSAACLNHGVRAVGRVWIAARAASMRRVEVVAVERLEQAVAQRPAPAAGRASRRTPCGRPAALSSSSSCSSISAAVTSTSVMASHCSTTQSGWRSRTRRADLLAEDAGVGEEQRRLPAVHDDAGRLCRASG